jgi:Protein of unknown function (DUF4235)
MAAVVKTLFIPVSIGGGLFAGLLGKKIFQLIWGMLDDQEPPDSEHRQIDYRKLAMALALEGAIFRLVKGFADHGMRQGVAGLTGEWPGEEEPDPQ